MKIGKDCVVMGNVSENLEVGEGSVVIGATDLQGNTIINQPMAVGREAKAALGCIAIGAGATAGTDLFYLIDRLTFVPEIKGDPKLLELIENLTSELRKPEPKQETLSSLWLIIDRSAKAGGALRLAQEIGKLLGF